MIEPLAMFVRQFLKLLIRGVKVSVRFVHLSDLFI